MVEEQDDSDILSPAQVAKLLFVTPATVRLWADKGELPAQTTPGGHRRFKRSDIEKFARSRCYPLKNVGRNKLRILIVDDEKPYSIYIQKIFSKFSDQVITEVANDGFEAGLAVTKFKPDVVILDLMMNGMDGFEVCRRIKSSDDTKMIRVIAMTGHPSSENVDRIINAGAETCIPKPIKKSDLFAYLGIETEPATDNLNKVV